MVAVPCKNCQSMSAKSRATHDSRSPNVVDIVEPTETGGEDPTTCSPYLVKGPVALHARLLSRCVITLRPAPASRCRLHAVRKVLTMFGHCRWPHPRRRRRQQRWRHPASEPFPSRPPHGASAVAAYAEYVHIFISTSLATAKRRPNPVRRGPSLLRRHRHLLRARYEGRALGAAALATSSRQGLNWRCDCRGQLRDLLDAGESVLYSWSSAHANLYVSIC